MPEPQFARSLERAERKFDLMQAMGARLMLCCSNTSPLAIDDRARRGSRLRTLAERAASAACASASRRWPGARHAVATARPGTSCAGPTIRTWA